MRISGKIRFQDLGTGVWVIEDQSGKIFLPINMPEQLKIEGEEVRITARRSAADSLYMTGTPIEITSFHTLPKFE